MVEQGGGAVWPDIHYDYRDCQVLVTGGSSGIGLGIARAYAAAGARVAITGTRAAALDYDQDLDGFDYHQLQLTDNVAIDELAQRLQVLDVLVNNAGANFVLEDEYLPEVFERAMQVNLFSAYRLAAACRNKLAASRLAGGGSLIGLASMTSLFGNAMVPGYGAAKAALAQLTKTLGIAWAEHGIRVNAIAAGLVETNMTAMMLEVDEMMAPMLERTPLKRVGQPADIAGVALFLSSAAASYITGQTLPVDGGYSISG